MMHQIRHDRPFPGARLALAGAMLVAPGTLARAHDAPAGWTYDLSCCSNRDCFQSPAQDVHETPFGYKVTSTGELIAYQDKRIKHSRDEYFHRCSQTGQIDSGRTLCLYVPDRNM